MQFRGKEDLLLAMKEAAGNNAAACKVIKFVEEKGIDGKIIDRTNDSLPVPTLEDFVAKRPAIRRMCQELGIDMELPNSKDKFNAMIRDIQQKKGMIKRFELSPGEGFTGRELVLAPIAEDALLYYLRKETLSCFGVQRKIDFGEVDCVYHTLVFAGVSCQPFWMGLSLLHSGFLSMQSQDDPADWQKDFSLKDYFFSMLTQTPMTQPEYRAREVIDGFLSLLPIINQRMGGVLFPVLDTFPVDPTRDPIGSLKQATEFVLYEIAKSFPEPESAQEALSRKGLIGHCVMAYKVPKDILVQLYSKAFAAPSPLIQTVA